MFTFRFVNFIAVTVVSSGFVNGWVSFEPSLIFASKCDNFVCTDIPNYPTEYIKSLVVQNDSLKLLTGSELAPSQKAYTNDTHINVCHSKRFVHYPKAAKNNQYEWKFILNPDKEFRQGIRMDVCVNPNKGCSLDSISPDLKTATRCVQHYSLRRMVALDYDGVPTIDSFSIPTGCKCYFKPGFLSLVRDKNRLKKRP